LLKQSAQRHHSDIDQEQITRARKEAEALFRPKPKVVEQAAPPGRAAIAPSTRRPRILSVSVRPAGRADVEAPARSEARIRPAVSAPQANPIDLERRRLLNDRAMVFRRQRQLQAKLDAIDSEMCAIDAYETVRNGSPEPQVE
jgi:hypothetical protein